MRYLILVALSLTIWTTAPAQFVARMQIKEPISGICHRQDIYVFLPGFKGQDEAVCPISTDSIVKRLNAEVEFVKNNADYNDKGTILLVVNCKHELVYCKMDNRTKRPDLDKQIEAIFEALGAWQAGKLNGKPVDSARLFSFTIINGVFGM